MTIAQQLINTAVELKKDISGMSFQPPVTFVYNPLDYAWDCYTMYVNRYGNSQKKVVFLGMNPGPWGMAQTGVPFGEIDAVKDFLGIDALVKRPTHQHPKRPIMGLDCSRSEVSGKRLWGLFADRFGTAETFFKDYFVANYCPLVFLESTGRNRTPDKLKVEERKLLFQHCDSHLQRLLEILEPQWIIGVGRFAHQCIHRVITESNIPVKTGIILHPSPASPAANKDWAGTVTRQLTDLSIWN